MSGFIFAAMWIIIALYLFFLAFTEDTFFFFIAPFFAFLGVWQLLDRLNTSVDMMAGPAVWIYRGVATVMLIICGIKLFLNKRNG